MSHARRRRDLASAVESGTAWHPFNKAAVALLALSSESVKWEGTLISGVRFAGLPRVMMRSRCPTARRLVIVFPAAAFATPCWSAVMRSLPLTATVPGACAKRVGRKVKYRDCVLLFTRESPHSQFDARSRFMPPLVPRFWVADFLFSHANLSLPI